MSTSFNPRNSEAGECGVNISGACYLRTLLSQLGFEEGRHISGVGCGPRIPARKAREWGRAILQALSDGSLRERQVRDQSYMGGWREEPYIGPATLERVPTLEEHFFEPDKTSTKKPPKDLPSSQTRGWLTQIANFFIHSSGFSQS